MKQYHFIGIGGIGMSALARILLEKKILVSGSDLSSSDNIEQLKHKGAIVKKGHSAKHISRHHTVVFSSGIKKSNPELIAAEALNCPMLHRSELLAELMQGYRRLVCTGTHGKTTTSSLLAAVLAEGGLDPSFAVGGMIQGVNGKLGRGSFFVAEADESDGSFLNYFPEGAIITNIEPEHMDHYKNVETLHGAFKTFFNQVHSSELLFYCGDDPILVRLAEGKGVTYGFSEKCSLHISHYCQIGWESHFDLAFDGCFYPDVKLALVGEHNVLNAAAVFGMALRLGIKSEKIRQALATFSGVERRCEKKKEVKGVLFLDDYAHHPTEIRKTIEAVKGAIEERRLVVLFQPHRYTRTRDTLDKYADVFEMADQVYVTDIYPAGEKPIKGITAEKVVGYIQAHSSVPCSYIPRDRWKEIELFPHDVFLTVGAGDVAYFHQEDISPRKMTLGVVFGGLSCEHEISVRSARFVSASLNQELYNIRYFGIDKSGKWVTGDEAKRLLNTEAVVSSPLARPVFDVVKELEECDLLVPILHGTYGEDGTLQGFFEILGKPYLGPDFRSAALSMDKVLTKRIVASEGILTPKDLFFGHIQWNQKRKELFKKIKEEISFPVYVKPIHLGSSVGITYVEKFEEIEKAIETAFKFDILVMVEEAKNGCHELEFAVIGNSHAYRVLAPSPAEKLASGIFVDYEKKYGSQPVKTTLFPDLDPALLKKGQDLASKAYQVVGCSGMTRVDFLLDVEGNYWFFEMNSIPGQQPFSLFPKIWEREGVSSDKLYDQLIILALQRKRQQDRHFAYNVKGG